MATRNRSFRQRPSRRQVANSQASFVGSSYARRLRVESLEDRRMLAVFTVTNNGDSGAGSLRDAITQANGNSETDTITFDAGVFSGGSNSLIRLTSGELEITDTLTIDGSTATDVTITGDANDDDITDGANITNVAASFGGTPGAADDLLDDNSRVLNFSRFTRDLTLHGLTITGGRSSVGGDGGGGIRFRSDGSLTLTSSTVSGNSTTGLGASGGGIFAHVGSITLTNSTVSGNSTTSGIADGGGIYTSYGDVSLSNSTVSGNSSGGDGGAIYTYSGDVSLESSTVTGNLAAVSGGGVHVGYSIYNPALTINNSIVAGNIDNGTAPDLKPDPNSTLSINHSLIGSTSGSGVTGSTGTGNILNQAPLLGPLADNGGPTMTHALLPGSPAINAGNIRVAVPGVFGTGLDANGNLLADNQDDPHYEIISQPNSGTLTDATVEQDGFPIGPWVSNSSTSRWIGPNTNDAVGPAGEYVYRTEFDLTGFEESTAFLSGNWATDNSASLWINGFEAMATTEAEEFGSLQSFTDPSPFVFVPGINVLEFRVTNGGVADGPTGLRVDDLSVTAERTTLDQRGFSRNGMLPDIGAYERQTVESTTLVVSTNSDTVDGNYQPGELSLREAIEITNNSPGADTIIFDAGVFSGDNNSLIRLTSGELAITETLTIDGTTGTEVTITGDADDDDVTDAKNVTDVHASGEALLDDNSRVLNFSNPTGDLTLSGLTLTGGRTTADNEFIDPEFETTHSGGGIRFISVGALTLTSSTVSGNSTSGLSADGGGIFTDSGSVTLTSSTVSGNSTSDLSADGGGIFTDSGSVSLTSSTLSGNSTSGANAYGGGIYTPSGSVSLTSSTLSGNSTTGDFSDGGGISTSSGNVSLTSSTLSGNSTSGANAYGGGIFTSSGSVSLTSSTLSGNSTTGASAKGGGIATLSGSVTLTSSTVTGNEAMGAGGGVFVRDGMFNPDFMIENSILAGNLQNVTAPNVGTPNDLVPDPESTLTINHSLIGVADNITQTISGNVGNLTGTAATPLDPLLGPFADNGGPTLTHALLPGSPALNLGSSGEAEDQRGEDRNDGSGVDIGAYEAQIAPSADFDSDGDVDGADFLAWQRGFGTPNAQRADGNGDDDTDVDASDLAAWTVSYGETTQPLAAVGVDTPGSEVGSAELIDAAIAWEWLGRTEHEQIKLIAEIIISETASASGQAIRTVAPKVSSLSESETSPIDANTPSIVASESAEQSWLAEELLERVFG